MSIQRAIELREQQASRSLALSGEEVGELLGCGARLDVRDAGAGRFDVTAAEVVGVTSTRHLRVSIRPKVGLLRLISLLAYATSPVPFLPPVSSAPTEDLAEAIARMYATALDAALSRGLPHAYERRQDHLQTVRGRVDATTLALRRHGVFPPMPCDFDEFTADNEVNRRLFAASTLVLQRGCAPDVARSLRRHQPRFVDVELRRYTRATLTPLHADRRFARLSVASSLADIILRHGSAEMASGAHSTLGFLIDMNRLFEDLVVEGLRPHMPSSVVWSRQPLGETLDLERSFTVRPDAVARRRGDGKVALVLDAKYKVSGAPRTADAYQAVSYGVALGSPTVALVYPSVESTHHRIRGAELRLGVFALALDCEPAELRVRLGALADELRGLGAF